MFLCVTISSHRFIYLFLKTLSLPWLSQELGIFSPSARLPTILNIYLPFAKPKKYLSIFSNLACWHFIQNSLSFPRFLLPCTTALLNGDEQPADGSLPFALPSQGPSIPLCPHVLPPSPGRFLPPSSAPKPRPAALLPEKRAHGLGGGHRAAWLSSPASQTVAGLNVLRSCWEKYN